jgi:DNA-binding transcriptional LysR family regulator
LNWDDLKFFLMVCRVGSIRAAAVNLKVNHATVSRRIKSFEASLGQRLFERTPQGYIKTPIGEEIYEEASHLEERLNCVERRVIGKDNTLFGEIRVTLPDIFAQKLLMPFFGEFCQLYPEIELEIFDSTKVFNLANREADIAFRLCHEPPEYLIGRKLAVIHRACYMAKKSLPKLEDENWLAQQNWIGWTDKFRRPVGKLAREYPKFRSKHKIVSAALQAQACINEMGISILPCFIADIDPELVRVPPYTSEGKYDLWVLNHPDLRNNAKIQTFVRFMTQKIQQSRALIEGETPSLP